MANIIVLLIAATIVGFAIYKATRAREPIAGGIVEPDEIEKPSRPIDRR